MSSTPAIPLSPPQQQLATNLTQADSQLSQLQAAMAQNRQQQTQLQAQVGADQAQVQELNQQIGQLQSQAGKLASREKQERAQVTELARAIYAQPSSALLSVMEASSLGDYLTQNASLDDAAQQAHRMVGRLESTRQQAQASERSLTQKRSLLTAEEQQAQATQTQLQSLAAQLQGQQAQLAAQTTTTQAAIAAAQRAAVQQGGSLTGPQAALLTELGTGGLAQQMLEAGLASGLYTLSVSSIAWPSAPDPSPLGLTAYPGYCDYTPIQCTCYAANAYQAYTGVVLPQNLGNAGQWISGAQAAGIPTTQTPAEGAIVVFNGPNYSAFGHVALVRSVIYAGGQPTGLVVWERNMDDAGSFDVRVVALGSGSEIAGYIPPPASVLGGSVPQIITNAFSPLGPAAVTWGLAVAQCESSDNPNAVNPSGAEGLFQFMPSTFAATPQGKAGQSIWDPAASAGAAAWMYSRGQQGQWQCNP